jgi:hypothetical protein
MSERRDDFTHNEQQMCSFCATSSFKYCLQEISREAVSNLHRQKATEAFRSSAEREDQILL